MTRPWSPKAAVSLRCQESPNTIPAIISSRRPAGMRLGIASQLALPNLTAVTQGVGYWLVNALSGGQINLSGLTSLDGTAHDMYFTDTGGSTIVNTKLTSLMGVTVTTDGSDTQLANAWTSFTNNGNLTVTGGSYNLSGLKSVNDSTLVTQSGGVLTLPGITKYDSGNNKLRGDRLKCGTWYSEPARACPT